MNAYVSTCITHTQYNICMCFFFLGVFFEIQYIFELTVSVKDKIGRKIGFVGHI